MTIPERVRFTFGDRDMVGRVVDAEPTGTLPGGPDWRLRVDVDGITYPTLASEAEAV
ncbi:hypothetical protein [Halorarum salinum]|uniref:Uncharacterized protein n=1 Tax=Halorarum salinum TaxID=2743089 RepID=A0A7D5QAS4_9EURY|nr:hypothetical protein [Halobaculum salinum]QLG62816.1 hypothetical protein HUG12_14205 [Halobaculum salinum]